MTTSTTTLFSSTTRPDPTLFFQRNEADDIRLGEVVRWQITDYAAARVVLLGCPQDEGVLRNGGRIGAADAPDAIRLWLYRLVAPPGLTLFDLGNTMLQSTLEATHLIQQHVVRQVIADGKQLIVLGGGNDIAYPDCAGLAQETGELLAFHVDAHLDVRDSPLRNSATSYRMLLEEEILKPANVYAMAYQPFAVAEAHLDYLRNKGAYSFSLRALQQVGVISTFQRILWEHHADAIFWDLDMDVVRMSEAPGVSAPNPLGMSGDLLCQIAALAGGDPRSRLLEISEVNPTYDRDNCTARLAAVAIFHFLAETL